MFLYNIFKSSYYEHVCLFKYLNCDILTYRHGSLSFPENTLIDPSCLLIKACDLLKRSSDQHTDIDINT